MHTQLLLHGAIDWRERAAEGLQAQDRAAHLFGRAASRLDPLPVWVVQACEQFGVEAIDDPAPAAPAPSADAVPGGPEPEASPSWEVIAPAVETVAPAELLTDPWEQPVSRLWPPSQLAEEVEHWLLDSRPRHEARVGLACVPGAAMLCREGSRLDLNIAALLADPSGVARDPWMEALRDPLQRALASGWLQQLELREPFSSLYESLSHHWKLGGALPRYQLLRLPSLLDAWQRLLGPAQLKARRLPSTLVADEHETETLEGPASLMVRLDPLELDALAACDPAEGAASPQTDEVEIELEAALARLRREHHNRAFWEAPAADSKARAADRLEPLRLLLREAGFYASVADGLGCLRRWQAGALACLERAQVWAVDPSVNAPDLLSLGQIITEHSGSLPCLRKRLPLIELFDRMGGREVVYVGWEAEAVLEQHRSGRAFRLFADRPIVPYGLRVVAMPGSRHPHRPQSGFRESLDQLVAAVEREHAARPLDLLLVDQGAYRLPLLELIERRHGVVALAPGPELLQLFGLDRPGLPRWWEERRDPAMWRQLA